MLGELKKAGTVRGNTVVKKAKAHTWEMCSLAERIQLTWFQGEDYGLEEMLSWRNDKYSQALKHNNIIVSGSVRDSVAGTFPTLGLSYSQRCTRCEPGSPGHHQRRARLSTLDGRS